MSAEKTMTARDLMLRRKNIQRHKKQSDDKAECEQESFYNKIDFNDHLSPRNPTSCYKENVHISHAAPKSPRVQKKVVVKVVDSCSVSPRKSTRLQAKISDEQKSSLDSPSMLLSKGKPSVQQILSDSPQGRTRYKRNHTEGTVNGGGQSESGQSGADTTTHVPTPRAKDITVSVKTKRGGKKVYSHAVDDNSDSGDDFSLAKPKSTPTKQIIKNADVAAKGKTPTKIKGTPKRGKALDAGASSKLKSTVENSQALRTTPTKHSGNASSDSSRTPSPCFHVWPPRNL